jgi:mono/diheme cytochrome c family protein
MPAWNGIVDDDERWNLVNYIRSLKEMDATESN